MAWLRRGLGAVLADLEPFLGLEPRHSPQASPVHRTLLALGHGRLSLPAAATFTQLRLAGADVPVTARASSHLKAHLVLSVPRPSGRAEMASPLGSSSHVPLHRLTLHDHEAAPLNAELARFASGLAQSQPGVGKTNLGGWQSADELFEGSPSACCAKLQAIASAALDEAQRHHQQTGALKEEEMKEELKEALEEEHCGAPTWHASHAWLNVNRSGDSNEMHMHDARRWSAVYFVAGRAGGTAPSCCRRLYLLWLYLLWLYLLWLYLLWLYLLWLHVLWHRALWPSAER